MAGWLAGRVAVAGWLTGRLAGWPVGRLADWLAGWLALAGFLSRVLRTRRDSANPRTEKIFESIRDSLFRAR